MASVRKTRTFNPDSWKNTFSMLQVKDSLKGKGKRKSLASKRRKSVRYEKAFQMAKVRISSIRDRWLMNVSPSDHEIFLASAFMLLMTKREIQFIKDTKMSELVMQDAINLEHFLEYLFFSIILLGITGPLTSSER